MSFPDYRDLLRRELSKRKDRNASYTQSAFARDLGIRPNRLSEIFSGKQGISLKTAIDFAERLQLPEEERILFCELVRYKHARSITERHEANQRLLEMASCPVQIVVRNESDSIEALTRQISSALKHVPKGAELKVRFQLQPSTLVE